MWIWKAIYGPGGGRLPKLPKPEQRKWEFSPYVGQTGYRPSYGPSWQQVGHRNYVPEGGVDQTHHGTAILERPKPQMNYGDCIQFYGTETTIRSGWSMCRCCGIVCWDEEGRNTHRRRYPQCMRAIYQAADRLRKDLICVCCNTKATSIDYAVPLCGIDCMKTWLYLENHFMSRKNLEAALKLVGYVSPEGGLYELPA